MVMRYILYSVLAIAAAGCVNGSAVKDNSLEHSTAAKSGSLQAGGSGGNVKQDTNNPAADAETNRYAVYDAVLGQLVSTSPDTVFVVKERTVESISSPQALSRTAKFLSEKFTSLSQATLDDYGAGNRSASTLQNLFKSKVVLLTKSEEEEIFKDVKGWEKLRGKYNSNGVVAFSSVGLNREMNQALVYVDHQRSSLDGVGRYVLLVKANGEWKVTEKADVSYS